MRYLMVYLAGFASAGVLYCGLLAWSLRAQEVVEQEDWCSEGHGAQRW